MDGFFLGIPFAEWICLHDEFRRRGLGSDPVNPNQTLRDFYLQREGVISAMVEVAAKKDHDMCRLNADLLRKGRELDDKKTELAVALRHLDWYTSPRMHANED